MKIILTERKNILHAINSRLDITEESFSEFRHREIGTEKEKKIEKNAQSISENGTSSKNLYAYNWSLQSGKH